MKKAFFQLHIAVFLAGFTGVLGRLITLNEAVLVWYRMMIACVVLWLFCCFGKENLPPPRKLFIAGIERWIPSCLHWVTFLRRDKNFQCFHRPGLSFLDGLFHRYT